MEKFIKWLTLGLIIFVFLMLIFFAIVLVMPQKFEPYTHIRETLLVFATSLTVLATLLLVYATFRLAETSRDQEQRSRQAALESETRYRQAEQAKEDRYRQDQRDREKREEKELRLNEIQDWVNRLNKYTLDNDLISVNKNTNSISSFIREDLPRHRLYFEAERLNCEYFSLISKELSKELEIETQSVRLGIEMFSEKLKYLYTTISEFPAGPGEGVEYDWVRLQLITDEIKQIGKKYFNSLENVLTEIAKAKLALLKE